MKLRIGFGYDVHRFIEGKKMMLGGVEITHSRGLEGHSDADALLHAICDALLGAAGMRDIGHHFPNTDPELKDIDSRVILERTWLLISQLGWKLGNLDCTVVAEAPKVNPHVDEMKKVISVLLKVQPSDISIKATTKEGLGAIGREEGLEAYAVALIISDF